jgi:hypothetical protein
VAQQSEADAPLGAAARVDAGGVLVDAHDGADHRVEVLVLEGDLLAAAESLRVGRGAAGADAAPACP